MEFFLNNKVLKILIISLLLLNSCKNEEKIVETTPEKKVKYVIPKPSEMANLMNAMYAYNLQIKQQIMNGETPVVMPLDLVKLHSAEMSNGHGRTAVWNSHVNEFITAQQSVVDTLSDIELKMRYNDAINNCLACHKTECTGPIPKIKKLLIQ